MGDPALAGEHTDEKDGRVAALDVEQGLPTTRAASGSSGSDLVAVEGVDVVPYSTVVSVPPLSGKAGGADDVLKERVAVVFTGVSYVVKAKRKEKVILDDVSGYFYPGNLTAIMGPSGSGKTTLMDIVVQRKNTGKVTGELLSNGQPLTKAAAKKLCSYVEQDDVLLESLTVHEMMTYTAMLCWPWKKASWRRELVDNLITTLGLEKCRASRIGGPTLRGVSGGERRRVFIGAALVAKPQVLLLDEPTSGLDSFMAREVMSFIKMLVVQRGITVATTIHQPSAAIFTMFDWLMLLLRGKIVFFGDVGQLEGCFSDLYSTAKAGVGATIDPGLLAAHYKGQPPKSDGGSNLAESVMDYICLAEREQQERELAARYESSALAASNNATREQLRNYPLQKPDVRRGISTRMPSTKLSGFAGEEGRKWWQLPVIGQLRALLRYRSLANLKHPAFYFSRIFGIVMLAFILTTLYTGNGDQFDAQHVQNTTAVLFLLTFVLLFNAVQFISGLVNDRPVFYHEHDSGLYSTGAYQAANTLMELAIQVPSAFALAGVVYAAVQLQGNFMLIVVVLIIMQMIATQFATFAASVGATADAAAAVCMLLLTSLAYTAGFYANFDTMGWYWRWIGYVNPLRFGFAALIINQYDGHVFEETGEPILAFYGLEGQSAWMYVGFCAAVIPVVYLAAWLVTSKIRHSKN